MITVREIRVGDLVSYNDKAWYIKGIELEELKLERNNKIIQVSPNEVSPILLTEDLLLKIGFEASEQGCDQSRPYREYNYNGIVLNLFLLNEPIILYCPDDTFKGSTVSYSRPPLKYVHQLQNLFYVLTGKELELPF